LKAGLKTKMTLPTKRIEKTKTAKTIGGAGIARA
jgi:hypothetical protein